MKFNNKSKEKCLRMRSYCKGAMKGLMGLCWGLLMVGQVWAVPVTVFSEDFSSGLAPAEFSGVTTVVGVQGYAGLGGFSGNFLHNTSLGNPALSTTLTLSGLAPHDSVQLNFLLAVIDSWDGSTGIASPDFFNFTVDGTSVFSETFENFGSISDQSFDPMNATGARLARNVALGFNPSFNDAAYNMGVLNAIPHTNSMLTVSWFASGAGWQGVNGESWAIDNVEVIINTTSNPIVPEPSTLLLMGSGLAGLVLLRRHLS